MNVDVGDLVMLRDGQVGELRFLLRRPQFRWLVSTWVAGEALERVVPVGDVVRVIGRVKGDR